MRIWTGWETQLIEVVAELLCMPVELRQPALGLRVPPEMAEKDEAVDSHRPAMMRLGGDSQVRTT